MYKELAVLVIHGMGKTNPDFAKDFETKLMKKLKKNIWNKVHFDRIYYQDVFQKNEERVYNKMKKKKIHYNKLRKFILFGFSDAIALERSAKNENSPYERVQATIKEKINDAHSALGDYSKPIMIIAYSLGAHIISNYIWDSQKNKASLGIWNKDQEGTPKEDFQKLKTLKHLFTIGCNIPIFLAGFPEEEIIPISLNSNGYNFEWDNYYDRDDVLGWPLKPISSSYKNSGIEDHQINVAGNLYKRLVFSWNPMSHREYWEENKFIKPVSKKIKEILGE